MMIGDGKMCTYDRGGYSLEGFQKLIRMTQVNLNGFEEI
jgi:hypothetical protein